MKEEKKQDSDEVDLSKAKESKARRFSLVWVIPIIAFIVFVILLWNNSLNKGPQITIKMPSAESVEEGKTSTITAIAKTNAPVDFSDGVSVDVTDEELRDYEGF